jgi:Ca2+-dependent lipid-binding protein
MGKDSNGIVLPQFVILVRWCESNLPPSLLLSHFVGLSDPFCIVELRMEKKRTKVCKKTLNPEWNESFTFTVPSPPPLSMKFTLWDKDHIGKDFLGVCHLPLDELRDLKVIGQTKEWVLNLQNRRENEKVTGDLKISIQLQGNEKELEKLQHSLKLGALMGSGNHLESICNGAPGLFLVMRETCDGTMYFHRF